MERKLNVVVVGGGVIGALIAREFSRYECELTLIEKELDVGWGVSKANSAILHGGYDDPPGSVRARFCFPGNQMYDQLQSELHFDLKRTGSYVLAFRPSELPVLDELMQKARENGVEGCAIHSREQVLAREPNVRPDVEAGFFCPQAGITEPWMVAITAVESAKKNGLQLRLGEEVNGVQTVEEQGKRKVVSVQTPSATYPCDIVVNAAGLFSDEISRMAGAPCPELYPRKGEYILLDKKPAPLVQTILFPVPDKVSKGILVLPTVDGGTLLGPTAQDMDPDRKEDTSTTSEGFAQIFDHTIRMVNGIDLSKTVKTFSGLRPESPQKDFVLEKTPVEGFFNAAAMRSPALTSAPAIARYVVEDLVIEQAGFPLQRKIFFDPFIKPYAKVSELGPEEWEKKVRQDPRFGKMICVCNEITEGEILEAIERGATTIDGVKFRTRASFGRCQGGFCLPRIVEILARELRLPEDEVRYRSGASTLLGKKVRS